MNFKKRLIDKKDKEEFNYLMKNRLSYVCCGEERTFCHGQSKFINLEYYRVDVYNYGTILFFKCVCANCGWRDIYEHDITPVRPSAVYNYPNKVAFLKNLYDIIGIGKCFEITIINN